MPEPDNRGDNWLEAPGWEGPPPLPADQYMALPDFRHLPATVRAQIAREYERWLHSQEHRTLTDQSPMPAPSTPRDTRVDQTSILDDLLPENVRYHRPRRTPLSISPDTLAWEGEEPSLAGLEGLRDSLNQLGPLFPIIVREPAPGDIPANGLGRYRLVDGRRRVVLARDMGRDSLPALVFRWDTPQTVLDAVLLSVNNHRNPNPLSESDAVARLVHQGLDQAGIARRLNLPLRYVNRRLLLAALHDTWRAQLGVNHITLGVAERIAGFPPPTQGELWAWYQDQGYARLTMARLRLWEAERQALFAGAQESLFVVDEAPERSLADAERIQVRPVNGQAVAWADPIRVRINRTNRLEGINTEARLDGERYVLSLDPGQLRHLAPEIQAGEDALLTTENIRTLTGPSLRNGERIRVEVQTTSAGGMTQGIGEVVQIIRRGADWVATVNLHPDTVRDWVRFMDGAPAAQLPSTPAITIDPATAGTPWEARAALEVVRLLNIHGGGFRALSGTNATAQMPLVEVTDSQERTAPGTRAVLERLLGPATIRPNRAPSWVIPRLGHAAAWAEAGRKIREGVNRGDATHVTLTPAELVAIPGLEAAMTVLCGPGESRPHRSPGIRWRLPNRSRSATEMQRALDDALAVSQNRQDSIIRLERQLASVTAERNDLLAASQVLREEVARMETVVSTPVDVVLPGPGDVATYQPGQGYDSVAALLVAALEDLPADATDTGDGLHSVLLEGLTLMGRNEQGQPVRAPAREPRRGSGQPADFRSTPAAGTGAESRSPVGSGEHPDEPGRETAGGLDPLSLTRIRWGAPTDGSTPEPEGTDNQERPGQGSRQPPRFHDAGESQPANGPVDESLAGGLAPGNPVNQAAGRRRRSRLLDAPSPVPPMQVRPGQNPEAGPIIRSMSSVHVAPAVRPETVQGMDLATGPDQSVTINLRDLREGWTEAEIVEMLRAEPQQATAMPQPGTTWADPAADPVRDLLAMRERIQAEARAEWDRIVTGQVSQEAATALEMARQDYAAAISRQAQTINREEAQHRAREMASRTAQATRARLEQVGEAAHAAGQAMAASAQWGDLLRELTDAQPADSRVTTDRTNRARRGP